MDFDFIAGPNHPSDSVDEQPTTVLASWLVMRAGGSVDFLVGVRPDVMTWRRSTPIAFFLPAERSVITSSGRRYILEGRPADRSDDDDQIRAMLDGHGIRGATDVTATYWAAMQAPVN